jgi:DNA polymerase (family X)
MERKEAARVLSEIAEMLELSGANRFKVRAYENAAEALLAFPGDLAEAVRTGTLRQLPGIGDTIFSNLEALATTGRLPLYDELRASFPRGLSDCLRVPGLGARKLRQLHDALGVDSLDALERACLEGRLEKLPGFGKKSADHYLRGIRTVRASSGLFLHAAARARAERLAAYLSDSGLALEVAVAGSLRRLREIVRNVNLVASSRRAADLAEAFRAFPEAVAVVSPDAPLPSVRFLDGLSADLRIAAPEEYAAALFFDTGSRSHTAGLRAVAEKRGWTLDERGLAGDGGRRIAAESEADLYEALDLAYVEPELREGGGEIEAAAARRLPALVSRADLRGVFHVHTDASDGRDDLETMVRAARDHGYACVAITDHSQSAGYAGGLTMDRMRAQREAIRTLRRRMPEIRILHGTEADILADGSIDYGDDFLAELDLVVASVHTRFGLDRDEQTARLIRAVRNPRVAILGHPTGRLLLDREGVSADMEAVIAAAAESGCALEVNASPHRMDLDWRLVRVAIERGATLAIDPDAHATRELDYVPNGLAMARKGWAGPGAVLKTLEPDALVAWLERRRGGPAPESVDRASG